MLPKDITEHRDRVRDDFHSDQRIRLNTPSHYVYYSTVCTLENLDMHPECSIYSNVFFVICLEKK